MDDERKSSIKRQVEEKRKRDSVKHLSKKSSLKKVQEERKERRRKVAMDDGGMRV